MSENTTRIDNKANDSVKVDDGIKEYRTYSLTDDTTNAMLKKFEKKGWKVISTDWDSKEGCYVIKYKTE